MENLLLGFVIVLGIIIVASILNEKKLHIPHDIALMIVAFLISVTFLGFKQFNIFSYTSNWQVISFFENFHLDHFLLEYILGFMMFATASKVHFQKILKNAVPIGYLSIITTFIFSVLYGILFYGVSCLLHLGIDLWLCILLGGILSATEPAAATSILSKLGVSKSLVSTMEGESLFNDGVGVAILVFVTEWFYKGGMKNFLGIVGQEFLGAILVGLGVSYILFKLLKLSNEPVVHILISLLTVSLSYVICDYYGFSGIIASAICGIYFSYQNQKNSRWRNVVDSKELYDDFWNVISNLLSGILYVLVGLSVISMKFELSTLILIPIAVLINLISRGIGVGISTWLVGKKKIPGHYSFIEFVSLMTWGGLRGGLSLALIMSVKDLLSIQVYEILFNITMITILFTTIIQGLTIGKLHSKIEGNQEEKRLIVIANK